MKNSLKYGIFPEKLKLALVKPIYKKGDRNEFGNYRPVGILPAWSKLFELAIAEQLMQFMVDCKLFRNNQHAYLKNKSTQTAIFDFLSRITEALEGGHLVLGMFLDLSKAYDCLDYNILLEKMESYGIQGIALKWFESHLENRLQRTSIMKDNKEVR